MFKVYGVTKETAKAAAEKKFKNLPLKKRMEMSPAEAEQFIQEEAAEAFKKMKPVVIGKPLDAPEFAQQLIDLTKKNDRVPFVRNTHQRASVKQFGRFGYQQHHQKAEDGLGEIRPIKRLCSDIRPCRSSTRSSH